MPRITATVFKMSVTKNIIFMKRKRVKVNRWIYVCSICMLQDDDNSVLLEVKVYFVWRVR